MIRFKETALAILVGGLVAGVVGYMEVRLKGRHVIRLAEKGEIAHHPIYRLVFLAATMGFGWIAYCVIFLDPRPVSFLLQAVFILFFLLPFLCFLRFGFMRIKYNEHEILTFSIWRGRREIPWHSLTRYRWNKFLQLHVFETGKYGKVFMSNSLPGLPWFWGVLAEKRPDILEMVKEQVPDLFDTDDSD